MASGGAKLRVCEVKQNTHLTYTTPLPNERKERMSKKKLSKEERISEELKRLKKERISEELKRLKHSFKDLDEVRLSAVAGLLDRAAFMRITLEDYEKDINENGSIEMFSQSENQTPYERERPVMRFYNTTHKNYQGVIKQLVDLLPNNQKDKTLEDIVSGLQKPN